MLLQDLIYSSQCPGVFPRRLSLLWREHAVWTEVLTKSRLKHVVLFQGESSFKLCLGVLRQGLYFLFQEHADGTEVLTKSRLRHVVLQRD